MNLSALNPFKRQNKTESKQVRSVNATANWPDDPRLATAVMSALSSGQLIGQRAAGLIVNDPIVKSASEILISMLVGGGTRLNTPDPEIDALFNDGKFDPSKILSMLALQQAVIRSWILYGEGVVLLAMIDGDFAVQVLHPDQLDRTKNEDMGGGRRIIAGVELDEYDRRVAYWLTPQADSPFAVYQPAQRFAAADVLHIFEREFPGQIRGISPLTPVLPNANTASIAVEAGLKKLQVSALLTAFLTTPDGSDIFDGNKTPSLEPGAMVRLNPGETVESVGGGDTGDLPGFLKIIYHQMATAIGTTYEDLTGDLSYVNYSSYRAGALSARRKAEARRKVLLIDGFLVPVFNRWGAIETLSGRPVSYTPKWIEPTWPEIDRQKEADADVTLLNAGLKSRKEIIEGRGREFEAVNGEIQADDFKPAPPAQPHPTGAA
jgi:lambda family phage portal protein